MILVAGATGYLGGMITRRLLEQGREVRILVRPNSDCAQLVAAGAVPVHGDLKDRPSLQSACEGIDVVITTANSAQRGGADNPESVDLVGNRNLIDATREKAVQQYLFVSAYGADVSIPVPFLQAKARTEDHLRASGLVSTILAPHIFMDFWIPLVVGSAVHENRPVVLLGPGECKHSFIAAADVAAFAVSAIGNPAAFNQKLVLGGPEAVSWRDIIAIAERVLGRAIPVQTPGPQAPPMALPEVIVGLLRGMELGDVVIPMDETAEKFGVRLTTVEEFVRQRLP